MPKYYLLGRHFLKASDELNARTHEAGETVEFDGNPGAAMLPLDCAARDAKTAVAKSRPQGAQKDCELIEARGRVGLTRAQKMMLTKAEAEIRS